MVLSSPPACLTVMVGHSFLGVNGLFATPRPYPTAYATPTTNVMRRRRRSEQDYSIDTNSFLPACSPTGNRPGPHLKIKELKMITETFQKLSKFVVQLIMYFVFTSPIWFPLWLLDQLRPCKFCD